MLAPLQHRDHAAAAPDAPAAALTVRALGYRRVRSSRPDEVADLGAAADALGRLAASEREHLCGDAHVDDYVVSSTILSMLLLNGSACGRRFTDAVSHAAPRPLDWMTCSYECAGWGYVFARSLAKAAVDGPRTLLLQIVDVDAHGFSYWHANPMWGGSGFGISTLLVDVRPADAAPLVNEAAHPGSAVVQLGRRLRAFCAEHPDARLAIPFFPAPSRRALLVGVGRVPLLPDGHQRFGHSFGSDPWISLLLGLVEERGADTEAVVSSLALNGYYSIARIALAADARFSLEVST
ncbi:hypothetical protein PQQ51_15555 [Paraburkholderia xenovorans]|uniref:hypothetical protein n=1 Tax=Paraburkholderia xenovorans TaxID=36873 RepID=UPI0038BBC756